jgi:phytoene synthase
LLDLIDARTFDLYDEPMATLAELDRYAAATSATVFRLAARILAGEADTQTEQASRHAGMASTIATLLQRLPLHSARGQRFVPDDLLGRHGALPADLQAGRATSELRNALADLREIARGHVNALKTGADAIPSRAVSAFLPAALLPAALRRLDRSGTDPFRPSILPQWRRQWILWRAANNPARFIDVGR